MSPEPHRREAAAIDRWEDIRQRWSAYAALRCPHCAQSLAVNERSLVCREGHRFDLSRRGHVDLASGTGGGQYDKALWEARREVIGGGFFEPLTTFLEELIRPYGGLCADAGCGEGSLTAALASPGDKRRWLGLDLSREGLRMAAGAYPHCLWAVADLARLPLAEESLCVVTNILSPAAYGAFRRTLKADGLLIKVLPAPDHLAELRAFWNAPPPARDADRVLARRCRRFGQKNIRATRTYGSLLPALAAMTPLGWRRNQVPLPPTMRLSLSLTVVWVKKEDILPQEPPASVL